MALGDRRVLGSRPLGSPTSNLSKLSGVSPKATASIGATSGVTGSTILVRDTAQNIATWLAPFLEQYSTSITETIVENLLNTYVTEYQSNSLPISSITPDYESNLAELQAIIAAYDNPAWTIQLIAATGTQLAGMIATAQTMNQLGFELALREAFIQLAQLASSIYAATIDNGMRISRMDPAYCTVSLTSTQAVNIPAYTQFSIGGINYFNRSVIILPANTAILATLYQGTVTTTSFTADGTAFQSYTFGNGDFAITNTDVSVSVAGVVWSKTGVNASKQAVNSNGNQIGSLSTFLKYFSVGLWEYGSTDQVYTDTTTPTGNAIIEFGNGTNGVIPPSNAVISIQYVETTGSQGNVNLTNQQVSCSAYSYVTGTATSSSDNGTDNLDPAEYKILSPGMYSAKMKPSTTTDYNAFALNYNGVVDAVFQGQQIFAPNDTTMCMYVKYWILPNTTWTTDEINQFTDWLTGNGAGNIEFSGANLQFIGNIAPSIAVDITVNLYCYNTANLDTVKSNVTGAINALFTPKAGYLGTGMATTDIDRAIENTAKSSIDYYDNTFSDILPGQVVNGTTFTGYTYLTLNTLTVNTAFSTRRGA